MTYLPAINPSAVIASDKYLVINTQKNRIAESAHSMEAGNRAAEVLNQHETRNGRPCIYKVVTK